MNPYRHPPDWIERMSAILLTVLIIVVMTTIIAAIVVATESCAAIPPNLRLPGYDGANLGTASTASPFASSPADTAKAFEAFEARAHEVFPEASQVQIHKILSNVQVTYDTTEACRPPDVSGQIWCTTGRTLSPEAVWIQVSAVRHDASTNALIHELVHVTLWALHGNPDADHEGPYPTLWTAAHTAWIDSVMAGLAGPATPVPPTRTSAGVTAGLAPAPIEQAGHSQPPP